MYKAEDNLDNTSKVRKTWQPNMKMSQEQEQTILKKTRSQ